MTRFDVDNNQTAVDNRNSIDKHTTTVWELVSNRWNDPDFNQHTEILTTLHSDFSVEINFGFKSIADLLCATPEKCESRFNSMVLDLKRVKEGWDGSGQGNGGLTGKDNDERGSMDNRASFVAYC